MSGARDQKRKETQRSTAIIVNNLGRKARKISRPIILCACPHCFNYVEDTDEAASRYCDTCMCWPEVCVCDCAGCDPDTESEFEAEKENYAP